jgi:hypothetical protein
VEQGFPYLLDTDGVPVRVIEAGLVPADHLLSGIVGLAHEEVRVEDRSGRALPGAVADDGLRGAVFVLYFESREEMRARAVVGAPVLGIEPDEPSVPTITQYGT